MVKRECTVLDPRGQPSGVFERLSMVPRLENLNKKTIYLVDVGFPGTEEFWDEVVDWFSRNLPAVKIVLKYKRGDIYEDDRELWAEIRDQGHAVVFGVGG